MFRNVYYNPKARNTEHVLASLMGRALYQKKILSREQFLVMTDYELESILRDHLWGSQAEGFQSLRLQNLYPDIKYCNSADEARAQLASLQKENLVLLERFLRTTSTGEHILTKVGKHIIPFSEACPRETEELRSLFNSREGYVLYSIPFSKLSIKKEAEEILRQCQATQTVKVEP